MLGFSWFLIIFVDFLKIIFFSAVGMLKSSNWSVLGIFLSRVSQCHVF